MPESFGTVAIVLHSHIPYVLGHNQLEEEWLFEAVAESYLPLLHGFRRLILQNISPQVTLGLTPVWLACGRSITDTPPGFFRTSWRLISLADSANCKRLRRLKFLPRLPPTRICRCLAQMPTCRRRSRLGLHVINTILGRLRGAAGYRNVGTVRLENGPHRLGPHRLAVFQSLWADSLYSVRALIRFLAGRASSTVWSISLNS